MTLTKHLITASAALAACTAAAPLALAQGGDSPPAGCTGTPSNTWVTVIAEGLRSTNGLLAVTVYTDDSKRFLVKNGAISVGRSKVQGATSRACVFLPSAGVYALVLYHDENANQKIDRSGLGLPQEGWGFSNNPRTFMGIPAFSSVRLNIANPGLVTRIHMKYP